MVTRHPSTRPAPTTPTPTPTTHPPGGAPAAAPAVAPSPVRIGVGIDTARYGHYAAFLRPDLQPAADELAFTENAAGYDLLRARLDALVAKHGQVHFHLRLDAAGQYADNLIHFLQRGAVRNANATPLTLTLSCGDPQRNKNYRAALFGPHKSDPVEARAAARYALNELPKPQTRLSTELRQLRQVAGRLQAVVRQRTRLINQFHQLLVHAFPELATLTKDLSAGWVLELLSRYPTATLLAGASTAELDAIPYLPEKLVTPLLDAAHASIASLTGHLEAELVREQVRQLRDMCARQKRLENLLTEAYHALPEANHLDTIPGIGDVTAAILTAFILDIDRFETPGKLVAYFGTLPIDASSGVERDGTPRGPKRYVMSKRGNDLVRRYLWMAALCAVRFNPAVRALYRRVVAKHPERKAIAIGHAMRKLLHLVFALWKSGQPFNQTHSTWDTPAHVASASPPVASASNHGMSGEPVPVSRTDREVSAADQAAGHTPTAEPARKVVTAACPATLPADAPVGDDAYLDFGHLKQQLPLSRVLDHLGLTPRLQGSGTQRRCACPIHRVDGRGRTFSVNLEENVFACHHASCQAHGDVIDLWAALHRQSLRAAALDLVRTFGLEPASRTGTEKRNG